MSVSEILSSAVVVRVAKEDARVYLLLSTVMSLPPFCHTTVASTSPIDWQVKVKEVPPFTLASVGLEEMPGGGETLQMGCFLFML